MDDKTNRLIWAVAIGQIVPVLLYPPASLASASPVLLGLAVILFAVVGFYLIQRRGWAKILTIFFQGFNIIIRLMLVLSHGANPLKKGGGINVDVIVVSVLAIAISAIIMFRFDVPEVDLAFTQ
jgi:F0F1-type ATP synthase membrane subunit a